MAEQGYGSEAHVSCAPGYVSEEASVLRCGHQGEWEGVMHPCTKVTLSNTNHTLCGLCINITIRRSRVELLVCLKTGMLLSPSRMKSISWSLAATRVTPWKGSPL